MKRNAAENPYNPDIAIFLIVIPFISAINYYLTYSNIRLSWFLFLTFSIDTVQGYIAWWSCRAFILFLDKKWPYEKSVLSRISIQLIATLVLGLGIISLLTELTSWVANREPAPLHFYSVDLFIIGIWFFFVNGIYVGLYYYNLWKETERQRDEEKRVKLDGLLVKTGKQEVRLSFNDIAGFLIEGEYVGAVHLSGRRYFIDQSLDKVEKAVPSDLFFRLNRQYVLHRQVVTGFRREENGKIIVTSNKPESFPSEIIVSRLKAPAFKEWFRPSH
jgi:hypothetical protein